MFKKMFKKWKQKRILRLLILHEILETLCTMCKYYAAVSHLNARFYAPHFESHFRQLKEYKNIIRDEIRETGVVLADRDIKYF